MGKFKNEDLVIIMEGKYKDVIGKVVDNEAPLMWVMLSTTNEIANVHENHMEKLNLVMKEEDFKEYEKLIKGLNVDIKTI
ncbi:MULTISPECIES: hypothetical protein [Bacillota]|jgi:hypothetical protein|uniref:hypothetical protein n=1 Tax=Bacillota TaxID=1239 RepID=UPI0011A05640|nr:hypothetical protein [Clostridium sp. UBA1652]